MLQPLKDPMPKVPIKKSEIAFAVMCRRLNLSSTDKKLHRDLYSALKHRSVKLAEWDDEVDAELAEAIINHVASVHCSLSLHEVIADIDIILKRIA